MNLGYPAAKACAGSCSCWAATIAYVALLNLLGMVVATVLFLIVLMRVLDRCGWPLTLAVALATAGSIYLVFGRWLKVPLPTGVLGF